MAEHIERSAASSILADRGFDDLTEVAQEGNALWEARLDLANTIKIVRHRIEQSRQRNITIGEENTKATLIDPILTAPRLELGKLRRKSVMNTRAGHRIIPWITLCFKAQRRAC